MPGPDKRILILGGTGDARRLSALLEARGIRTLTSLAGVTRHPKRPAGEWRKGGFGGVPGLVAFLAGEKFDAICDATHPFAAQMSAHAAAAAEKTGVPLIRLEQPAWSPGPGDRWTACGGIAQAVAAVPAAAHVFLTIGRQEAGAFFGRPDLTGVARMIESFDGSVPAKWRVIRERPPFAYDAELELIRAEKFTVMVSKNAGGETMRAKLDAARDAGCPVIMIARPAKPKVDTLATPEAAAERLCAMVSA